MLCYYPPDVREMFVGCGDERSVRLVGLMLGCHGYRAVPCSLSLALFHSLSLHDAMRSVFGRHGQAG